MKLQVPEGKHASFVILNGCECEPYLTCDHRVMVERAHEVVRGLRTIPRLVGAERGYVGIENNKPDAADAIRAAAGGDGSITVVPLEVKYPQGAEKFLIDAILHREVPSGRLPIDLEVVVHNIGTAVALTDLLEHGKPLIFGKNRDKGIKRGASGNLEVVSLGNGTSEADILVHDETNRTLAYMLAHLETPKPVGVFHVEARPAYEDAMAKQIEVARQRQGDGDINALLNRGETWVVE